VDLEPGSHDDLPPRRPSAAEQVMLTLAMIGLGVIGFVVTYVVVARAFGLPLIPDDVQIVRQLLVVVIIFPMAAVTAARMHIAVTIFSNWMSAKAKRGLTVFGGFIGLLLTSILLAGAIELFVDAFGSGEYFEGDIRIPYWIVYGAYAAALAVLWLRMAAMMVLDFIAARALAESR
jgi:TRAP-type C4-dicarboxylate transport system permease small subunit